MIEVNLFDRNSNHLFNPDDSWHLPQIPSGVVSNKIKYVRFKENYNGITIIADHYLYEDNYHIPKNVVTKHKIGWLLEQRDITGAKTAYWDFEKYINDIEFVMTHDEYLLNTYPNKTKFCALAYRWVKPYNVKIHNKTKNVSILYSEKSSCEGHALRHIIGDSKPKGLDIFGRGQKTNLGDITWGAWLTDKEDAFKDHRFTVCIENHRANNYFTEKIIDCFSTGTVPIYWGCPNIGEFFDDRGIIHVKDEKEMIEAIASVNESDYISRMPYILNNFEKSHKYEFLEDQIFELIKDL